MDGTHLAVAGLTQALMAGTAIPLSVRLLAAAVTVGTIATLG